MSAEVTQTAKGPVKNFVQVDPVTGEPVPLNGMITSSLTIANGASVSAAIDLLETNLVGLLTPAAWTAAALSIEVSSDNVTWYNTIYDALGSQAGYLSSLNVSSAYAMDLATLLPFRYLRLRSGTSASPVNQGASRVFTLITRPVA